MKRKKLSALIFAMGLMLASMTVCATEDRSSYTKQDSQVEDAQGNKYDVYKGDTDPSSDAGSDWQANDVWTNGTDYKIFNGSTWSDFTPKTETPTPSTPEAGDQTTLSPSAGGSCGGSSVSEPAQAAVVPVVEDAVVVSAPVMTVEEIVAHAQAVVLQKAAYDEGFANVAELQMAAALNKSAGEYYNNAVTQTPGIEEATPVAQGGNLIVDGVVTNMTATINKVDIAFVDSVRAIADGTVLNVVDVHFPAKAAVVSFYMPGVAADAQITAMQYVDGAWVDVEVKEVKADHVVLDLKQNGRVAFVAK